MSVPLITLHDGVTVPQLGFGTSPMDDKAVEPAVGMALEVGYRHVDTAQAYGNETGVGRALASSGLQRSDLFVTTKLDNPAHAEKVVRPSLEGSLERLGLDHVDLYLIHWPLPQRGLFVEVWEKFLELKQEGLARSVGVSNFLPEHLDLLQDETGVKPSVNQFELHPTHQPEEVINYCNESGIAIESYAPLGNATDLEDPAILRIAQEVGATPAQAILSWQLRRGFIAIPKSATPSRIRENFESLSVKLTTDQLGAIDAMHTGNNKVWADPLTFNG